MADLLPNIKLVANTMVDLYAETGIAVGTKLRVINVGNNRVRLFTKATEPNPDPDNGDGYITLSGTASQVGATSVAASNDAGDSGAWAYSPSMDGLINVQVFT